MVTPDRSRSVMAPTGTIAADRVSCPAVNVIAFSEEPYKNHRHGSELALIAIANETPSRQSAPDEWRPVGDRTSKSFSQINFLLLDFFRIAIATGMALKML